MSNTRQWTDYEAVAACEGFDGIDHDVATVLSAWQHVVNTGLAWKLQGWFGRTAYALIEDGLIEPPAHHHSIPSTLH